MPGSSGWHIAIARAGAPIDGGYLGGLTVVDGLIRHFVLGALDRFDRFADGAVMLDALSDEDARAATEISRIFRGVDLRYSSVGSWNEGGGLAAACRQRFGVNLGAEAQHDDADAVYQTREEVIDRRAASVHDEDTAPPPPKRPAPPDALARYRPATLADEVANWRKLLP